MAHTKSQGAAKRIVNVTGKRRGVKRFGSQFVNAGEIIIRQLGTKFHPGKNVGIAKDYTIFATKDGYISFRMMTGHHRGQKFVDVLEKKATKSTTKNLASTNKVKKVEIEKEKKTATKKATTKKTTSRKTKE